MSGRKIGVVGGGAAGMMAAVTAARQGAEVTLLEGTSRLGTKLLSTGNGRCNLGNLRLDGSEYYTSQPARVNNFLRQFDANDVISFFHGLGVILKEKNGCLYPACEQAAVVQDALRYELRDLHICEMAGWKADAVERDPETGKIAVKSGDRRLVFDRVILACGGRAAPKTGSDGSGYLLAQHLGHSLTPVVPGLVQLRCREDYLKSVAGVRADALISVLRDGRCVAAERGELQITEYGLSGIPVLQLSRTVNYILRERKEVELSVDFLPDYSSEEYERLCVSRDLMLSEDRSAEEFFTGMLHKKLMTLFIKLAGLRPSDRVSGIDGKDLKRVYELCRQWRVHVNGSNSYDSAQVCAGGVPLEEVTDRLESRMQPDVYFAGEILDVDGKCGGYNLHWAWCSGYLAAMNAVGDMH